MADLLAFKILPVLGRKVDVPADDPSMFRFVAEDIAAVHDAGGINFDLTRKQNACTKSKGYSQWSNSATSTDTGDVLGLFELYDGTNRNHLRYENGYIYAYDGSKDPADISGAVTFASDTADLYSTIKVGSYAVFADKAEHTPYAWKHGDAAVSKLISSGTEFKFRYLLYFMSRIMGFYSDQTNGNIDIRWSGSLPTPTSACEFAAANQLYVPNGDPITGVCAMGRDRAFVYSEDSISQIAYYPDYTLPFSIYTTVSRQGSVNHHSIVGLPDRHLFFNKNYGFCEYRGGMGITPISQDIEPDIQGINSQYYHLIVGVYIPLSREVCWTVPMIGSSTPNRLLYYNVNTGAWRWENRSMNYVDVWQLYSNYTWNNLVSTLGTNATWAMAGGTQWAEYTSETPKQVYATTDGQLYEHNSEAEKDAAFEGYFISPIMDFRNKTTKDFVEEIWLDIAESGNFDIDLYYRGGSTSGEVQIAAWVSLGSISANSPDLPLLRMDNATNTINKLHQFKIGTDGATEKFMINGITFRYKKEGQF